MKKIVSMSVDELKGRIVREEIHIEELDLNKTVQKNAMFAAIKERNALLKKISGPKAEAILKMILEKGKDNYKYFVQLNRAQYTDALLQFYLLKRFEEDAGHNDAKDGYHFSAQKSLDDKATFTFSYVSTENDQLNYVDKDLNIPLSLKSSIKITLKIVDSLVLLDKLDTHITQLGAQKIKGKIFDVLTSEYKAALGAYIAGEGLGFYSLSGALGQAQDAIKQRLQQVFAPFGMEVSDFIIRKIAIPKDIQNKVEDLAFNIRQNQAEMDAQAALARISLQNYEEKLAVDQKYPAAAHSLTEYEKDQALERYLIKIGRSEEQGPDRSIKIQQATDRTDNVIEKQVDVRPEPPKVQNTFKIAYIAMLMISLFVTFVVGIASGSWGAPLIMLGVISLIFGPVAAFNLNKFKTEAAATEEDTLGGN